ncbi:hypothetical protein A3SK_0112745 [Pseudomonas amygdali pv. tabaci str. 6605]|uniref:Uncharacterized protein n=1 Tax=Pseudomonas amygdali pv. lachrymans TaxID=53707 RepID=A0A0P9URW8_PSEAV|nr:hypothetical protein A3SK_0112745 [Pseudomonas amygdali pv. tabaci str. 6605]KIY17549.1 hypothetical protein RD00_16290 [Pseudomonas amygdali pv. tabaci]KPX58817.1 Unknown protein sequence [Pseudomonas amygdali pv. lachrymans]BCS45432.1 hypothetical protein Pta6605_37630 [Pseudomonas amygdali pv. tabaci]
MGQSAQTDLYEIVYSRIQERFIKPDDVDVILAVANKIDRDADPISHCEQNLHQPSNLAGTNP